LGPPFLVVVKGQTSGRQQTKRLILNKYSLNGGTDPTLSFVVSAVCHESAESCRLAAVRWSAAIDPLPPFGQDFLKAAKQRKPDILKTTLDY
jgi:hypothetical protein